MNELEITVQQYLDNLPDARRIPVDRLRKVILGNLPAGFTEAMSYGMIGFVVPLSAYPKGYHCNPNQPLPFINLASQKNFISLYHMGLYASPELLHWFTEEYPNYSKTRLDMGKSCIRFKKPENIPFELIGQLCSKMTLNEWVNIYETSLKKST